MTKLRHFQFLFYTTIDGKGVESALLRYPNGITEQCQARHISAAQILEGLRQMQFDEIAAFAAQMTHVALLCEGVIQEMNGVIEADELNTISAEFAKLIK